MSSTLWSCLPRCGRNAAPARLVGALAALILAGCGGSSHKTSTPATSAPATTDSTTTPATPTSGIASRVLTRNELAAGFTASKPSVQNTTSGWLASRQTPSDQIAAETKRLSRLGFIAGASEDLSGPGGVMGVSTAEQFKTPGAARSELANTLKLFKATAATRYKTFAVAGVPGALGLAETDPAAVNVVFTSGGYYYLVGSFVSAVTASSEATITAASRRLYQRERG
jgi:hypothetical protein